MFEHVNLDLIPSRGGQNQSHASICPTDPSDGFFYPVHPEKSCQCPWALPQVCPSFPLCLNHTSPLSSSFWIDAAIKHHIKETGGDLFCACMPNINDYAIDLNGTKAKICKWFLCAQLPCKNIFLQFLIASCGFAVFFCIIWRGIFSNTILANQRLWMTYEVMMYPSGFKCKPFSRATTPTCHLMSEEDWIWSFIQADTVFQVKLNKLQLCKYTSSKTSGRVSSDVHGISECFISEHFTLFSHD